MKKCALKGVSRFIVTVFVLMFAVMPFMAGCGGGGGGGGDSGGGGGTSTSSVAISNIVTDSGMTNGGSVRQSTQTMTGSVPNPTGSTTTYGGKAYLVLNGNKIPLNVVSSTSSTLATDPTTTTGDLQIRKASKDGKEYDLNYFAKIKAALPVLQERAAGASVDWVFSVTFSINAGSNTVSIEVYDLNNTLFARMDTWNVVGVIEPTSLTVTLSWNTNNTDIDLHMSPDDGVTHCYYSYKGMMVGQMMLDYDITTGYGPEHITINNATGSNKYKIKVYYYADHNISDPHVTTPTTAHVTAEINGEVKLDASSTMSVESTDSSWTSGAHVWDVGEVEVNAANRYTVDLADPDLSSFPNVKLTVTVTDPGNTTNPKVTGLAASNFYVINAGKAMSPVAVTASDNVYTLSFSDIFAGKRDIFVYAIKPAAGTTKMQAGLSATKTYGTNYAVFAGLNQYPASIMSTSSYTWYNNYIQVAVPSSRIPDGAGDFTFIFTDSTDTTGVHPPVSVTANSINPPPAAGTTGYNLGFAQPANYASYDKMSLTYKKNSWLSWCVKDITDLKTALTTNSKGMTNTTWDAANMTTFTDAAATKVAILFEIGRVAGLMKKYDLFLFHFSGHGSGMPADGNAAQYLCAYKDGEWISVNDLKDKLDQIPSAGGGITNAIVMMDACHSGNFIGKALAGGTPDAGDGMHTMRYRPFIPQVDQASGNLKTFSQLRDLTPLTNTYVMAAQTGSSFSWDDGNLKNGVFTYYLVQGINVTGKTVSSAFANSDHSPIVSGEEAFAYLNPKVRAWVVPANGYGAADFESPQVQDNDVSTATVLIYNW